MAEVTDFGPRKTIFILAIVAGCFAVLWPKIFYPMLTVSVTSHHHTDSSACCEVIFESDVTAVDIMQEMCQNILRHHPVDPRVRDALKHSKLSPQTSSLCREEVLARCGIDLSSFLAERERLGKTYKQVLEEIRSFNGSLCLKMNFGVPLSQLGTPHLIRYHILMPHNTIRQERRTPPHAGEMHPAMRERGRAIPSSHIVPRIVDRPEHIMPKMRPPLGGAGHVVPPPKGSNTMGILMPLYTIGIVLFFVYTIAKVLRKYSDSEIISEPYPGVAAEKEFRKMVFNPEVLTTAMTGGTLHYQRKVSLHTAPTIEELKDPAGDIEIDQLRQRLVETEAAMERIVVQMGNISRSVMHNSASQPEIKEDTINQESHSKEGEEIDVVEQSPTVKVMGMEMTASCESGQKCSRPTTPIIPTPPSNIEREKTPPKPIYLEGALPPQCELLVTDSETQAEKSEDDDDAPVVLSGKMTLSLISLDQIAAESEDETQDTKKAEGMDGKRREKILDTQGQVKDVDVGDRKTDKQAEKAKVQTEDEDTERKIKGMEDVQNNVDLVTDCKRFEEKQERENDIKYRKEEIEIKEKYEKKEEEEEEEYEEEEVEIEIEEDEEEEQVEEKEEKEEQEEEEEEEEEEVEVEEEEEEEEVEDDEDEDEDEEEEEGHQQVKEKQKGKTSDPKFSHAKNDESDGSRMKYITDSDQGLEQSEDESTEDDEMEDDDMDADEEEEEEEEEDEEDEEHEDNDAEEFGMPSSERITRKRLE